MARSHEQSNTDKTISRRDLAKGLAALGMFDDNNLIYEVVRARMQFVYEHGIEDGLNGFVDWLNTQTDVDAETKQTISDKVSAFFSIPLASNGHDW